MLCEKNTVWFIIFRTPTTCCSHGVKAILISFNVFIPRAAKDLQRLLNNSSGHANLQYIIRVLISSTSPKRPKRKKRRKPQNKSKKKNTWLSMGINDMLISIKVWQNLEALDLANTLNKLSGHAGK